MISGGETLGVRDDQLTQRTDKSGVEMRNDSAYGQLRDELTQYVKLCGALTPVQQPVHISILHEFENRLSGAQQFYPRCIGFRNTWSEEVYGAYNLTFCFELRIPAIQRQKKLLPAWCQPRQRV